MENVTSLVPVTTGFALQDGTVEFGRTGLTIHRNLTYDEWEHLGGGLQAMESGIQWVIGDWLCYGEQRYGEKYAQAVAAAETTGRDVETIRAAQWVAERIPRKRRRPALSWSHHRAVAALNPDEQDRVLGLAEADGWSVSKMRQLVRTLNAALAAQKSGRELSPSEDVPETAAPEVKVLAVDPVAEWERAQQRVDELEAVLASVMSNDTVIEIRSLHERLAQASARNDALLTEKLEAVRQARYGEGMLRKIRGALGVERDRDILAAIGARRAA